MVIKPFHSTVKLANLSWSFYQERKKMSASNRNKTQLLSKQRPWDDQRDSLPDWCFESQLIEK